MKFFFKIYGILKGLEQSMNPQLIKYSRETETSILLNRRDNRKKLFELYSGMPHTKSSNREHNIEPYKEQFGQRVLVNCECLKFKLQVHVDENEITNQVEPYYTTLCLFDVRNGRKISENFHFNLNDDVVQNMTKELSPNGILTENLDITNLPNDLKNIPIPWIKRAKQAIFNISNPHQDIFLVVRIEKILQGNFHHHKLLIIHYC